MELSTPLALLAVVANVGVLLAPVLAGAGGKTSAISTCASWASTQADVSAVKVDPRAGHPNPQPERKPREH